MIEQVITRVEQLTPDLLTDFLYRHELLKNGIVHSIRVTETTQSIASTHHRLMVEYTVDTVGPWRPRNLFLKLPTQPIHYNEYPIFFYNRLLPMMEEQWQGPWPFVRCLDAAWSSERQLCHLLLADLSQTHYTREEYRPPSRQTCEQLIDLYAQFHAFWWEHPSLGVDADCSGLWQPDEHLGFKVGTFLTHETIDGFESDVNAKIAEISETYESDLTAEQFALLCRAVSAWPQRRRERVTQGQGVTLIHRDPHPGNILYPREPETDDIKLIDWESWRIDTGTDDIAYMMAFHWPADARAKLETPLLKRYHQQLIGFGVQDYSWEDCLNDYRCSIIRFLSLMTLYWRHQFNRDRLKLGLQAFVDWECEKVL